MLPKQFPDILAPTQFVLEKIKNEGWRYRLVRYFQNFPEKKRLFSVTMIIVKNLFYACHRIQFEKGDENWSPETGGKSVGNPTILLEITSFKKMIPKHSHCSTPTRNIWESFLEFWTTLTPTLYFRSKA